MKGLICTRKRPGAPPQAASGNSEEGQSILEMTFAFIILLLLLVAIIDLGRAFDAYIVLTNAAREGARFGARNSGLDITQIQSIVATDVRESGTNVTNMDDFAEANVTVEPDPMTGNAVTVTVTYDFEMWFGGLVGMDQLTLQKQAVMPVFSP